MNNGRSLGLLMIFNLVHLPYRVRLNLHFGKETDNVLSYTPR